MVIKMTTINSIKTIQDLEKATYGGWDSSSILKGFGGVSGIHLAHEGGVWAGAGSLSTPNVYNLIYGQKVWTMLNREINALSVIPKQVYKSSGYRVLKTRALGGATSSFTMTDAERIIAGGVAENQEFTTGTSGAVSAAGLSPIKPEFDVLHLSPKTIAHQFEVSEVAQALGSVDDSLGDLMGVYREEIGITHAEVMNMMVLQNIGSYNAEDLTHTLTSLPKLVDSKAHLDAAQASNRVYTANAAINARLKQLYGSTLRTSAASFLDSVVNFGADYQAASRRNLTVNILNTVLRDLHVEGGSPKVIVTGYDTLQTLGELLQAQERYMGRAEIVPTASGVKGVKGREVGFKVATYHDIPIICTKDMPNTTNSGNTTGNLSDMLILDTDHIFMSVLKPTQYFESGVDSGDPFGVGKLGNRGLYRTMMELGCTFFRGQAKVTNLQ
jgi:hypothetical protein